MRDSVSVSFALRSRKYEFRSATSSASYSSSYGVIVEGSSLEDQIPRLNSSSSTARIVASLESFIDNFDPDQILCQAVDPFLNFLAIITFGRLLQADTDFSDLVESVTRATAFETMRQAPDGFIVVLRDGHTQGHDIVAPVVHKTRDQALQVAVNEDDDFLLGAVRICWHHNSLIPAYSMIAFVNLFFCCGR